MKRPAIRRVAEEICDKKRVVALTGAGMSVESGVPPFTGPGGIWTKYDPQEYGHVTTFETDPEKAWVLYRDIFAGTLNAQPHRGHYVLAELEKADLLRCLVTQNVDGLHQKAGSKTVVEFHGNIRQLRCDSCRTLVDSKRSGHSPSPRCQCGNYLRPNFVLYGEPIPVEALQSAWVSVQTCLVLLVIGTACRVYPAAGLPEVAKSAGATLVEINTEETALTPSADVFLQGRAGHVLDALSREVAAVGGG